MVKAMGASPRHVRYYFLSTRHLSVVGESYPCADLWFVATLVTIHGQAREAYPRRSTIAGPNLAQEEILAIFKHRHPGALPLPLLAKMGRRPIETGLQLDRAIRADTLDSKHTVGRSPGQMLALDIVTAGLEAGPGFAGPVIYVRHPCLRAHRSLSQTANDSSENCVANFSSCP